ncbi:MAG: DUF559 domain-containing protein [Ilumatobacteraceae bacterium]
MALRQAGVISRRQARALGCSNRRWSGLLERGELIPVFSDTAAVAALPGELSPTGRTYAAVLLGGDGSLASRRSALRLHRIETVPGEDVLRTTDGAHRRSRQVVFQRSRCRLDLEHRSVGGVPSVPPERALVDLGAVCDEGVVERATESLIVARLASVVRLGEVADAHARQRCPGASDLQRVLRRWPEGVVEPDSVLEVRAARLLRRVGLDFRHHAVLEGLEVDFALDRERTVVETDGFEFHGGRDAFERDRERDLTLAAAGGVIRLTWRMVVEQPDRTAALLGAAVIR